MGLEKVKFPFDMDEWDIREGWHERPPIDWQNETRLVLILAWVDGTGTPRTLWARRK